MRFHSCVALWITFIGLLVSTTAHTCSSKYELVPVGCYKDNSIDYALPNSVLNERDDIDWVNYESWLSKFTCRCAEKIAASGMEVAYFGIQFYGECWADYNGNQDYSKYGVSTKCVDSHYVDISLKPDPQKWYTGEESTNFVYKLRPVSTSIEETTTTTTTTEQPTTTEEKEIIKLPTDSPTTTEEHTTTRPTGLIHRNHLVRKIRGVGKEWTLTFKIKPNRLTRGWGNVVHLIPDNNKGRKSRKRGIMSAWLIPGQRKLHICFRVRKRRTRCFNTRPLPRNKYTKVTMVQKQNSKTGVVWMKTYINNKLTFKSVNKRPTACKNVALYSSDPWSRPANAFIKDLHFHTTYHGTKKNDDDDDDDDEDEDDDRK